MDVSPVVSSAVESSDGGPKQQLAIIAMKSAEQSQAALLQLFNPATAVPSPDTGRGQNLNISV